MKQHIVIRRDEYVAGSSEKPEVRVFTQTHASRPPAPWGKVKAGGLVWMKWSSGPIVSRGVVEGFRQVEDCTVEVLRNSVAGTNLYELNDYWHTRPPVFFGMAIFTGDEAWLDKPIFPAARSYGESWIILETPNKEKAWLTNQGEEIFVKSRGKSKRRKRRSLRLSTRFEILRRDSYTCRYCGRSAPFVRLQVDHVIPVSRGGTNDTSNLVAACTECNLGKSAKSARLDEEADLG